MRPRSRQQVSPSIEHVRNAHVAQADGGTIRTNPIRCEHSDSPMTYGRGRLGRPKAGNDGRLALDLLRTVCAGVAPPTSWTASLSSLLSFSL